MSSLIRCASYSIEKERIDIPANNGPARQDRASLIGNKIEFLNSNGLLVEYWVSDVARVYGETHLLLERPNATKFWQRLLSIPGSVNIIEYEDANSPTP